MNDVCYLIGTDEAGYGPKLGPLVVSATLWRFALTADGDAAPEDAPPRSLFDALDESDESVDAAPDDPFDDETPLLERWNQRLEPLCGLKGIFPVVDSKKLYHTGQLGRLERSARVALALTGETPTTFRELLAVLAPTSIAVPRWEEGVDFPIPRADASRDAVGESFTATVEKVGDALEQKGVRLLKMKSRRIHPAEFNALLEPDRLKSDLLADATLSLATDLIAQIPSTGASASPRIILLCDKLGGRNRYGDLLRRYFPDLPLRTFAESSGLSRYKIGDALTVRFQARGERNRPTAAASLASKYLRELSMEPFNAYWSERVPNLKPTAGYPEDARRFLADIESAFPASGLTMAELWRNK